MVRDRLYRTHAIRAEMYAGGKQFTEALQDSLKALEYAPPAARDFYRLFVAMAYARAGKHAQAIEETKASAARMTAKTPFVHRVHLGSVCGVSAKAAGQDTALSEAARSACVGTYVALGLEQLREARRTITYMGWLMEMPGFLSNSDLAPLRAAPKWMELFKP